MSGEQGTTLREERCLIGSDQKTFQYICCKRPTVLKIQRTYGLANGVTTLFSCCSSNKAGVGILFNNNFNLKILKAFVDPNGRFVICDIETNSKLLTLANVYAPNEDDPDFFQAVFSHLSSFHCEEIIIGGDFNLVLDLVKDKKLKVAFLEHIRTP